MNRNEQNKVISNLLYQHSVETEIEWFKKPENHADFELFNKMIFEINQLGYDYKYKTDVCRVYIKDSEVVNIILNYLGKFNNKGLTADLVLSIGIRENNIILEKLIEIFNKEFMVTEGDIANSYDNAFHRIKDKKYLDVYLKWLANREIAMCMPLTMKMLAQWKIPEARTLFMQYLNFSNIDETKYPENQILFISIQALSHYGDKEAIEKITAMQSSKNKDIRECVKLVLKKLKR